jgi:hypothetical protein
LPRLGSAVRIHGGTIFQIQLFFPVHDPVACAEILYGEELVANVYERPDGWKIDLFQSPQGLDLEECLGAIAFAKERLLEYVNRKGENPPEGLSPAGLSLWLTEKGDGTTIADRLREASE